MNNYIPKEAQKPFDFANVDDSITLNQVCDMLSISIATGRNWIRLGKLTALEGNKKNPLFSKKEILQLLEHINSSETKTLKSRRNKKKANGNKIYSDYTNSNINNSAIAELIEALPENIDENHIRIILANIVLQFAAQLELTIPTNLVSDILGNAMESKPDLQNLTRALQVRFTYLGGDDILGLVYMSLKNIGERKAMGAYYTCAKIVNHLIEILGNSQNIAEKTFFDPCCGSGNFLLRAALFANSPDNVYGQDNDSLAVMLTRANFALAYPHLDLEFLYEHFTIGDSLLDTPARKYDIVIGNPPWGYQFSEEDVLLLYSRYKTAKLNGIESYDLFIEKALSLLPQDGMLAFVLPEAILTVKAHETVRGVLLDEGVFSFVSYIGNPFSGVHCPSIILGVKKSKVHSDIQVYCDSKNHSISAAQRFSADSINLRSSNEERVCLERISDAKDKAYLKENATFALGIVTGNNKQMVLNQQEDGCEPILKGSDIVKYKRKTNEAYIRFAPKQFQQVAPTKYYRAPEKLLYRFICDTPVFAYDDKQTLSLNSCNLLIPHIEGLSIKYILAVLNSRVIDFFCRQTFNSIKLLRSHIEQIPIPIPCDTAQLQVVNIVDEILNEEISTPRGYDAIDSIIMNLYELTTPQKEIVYAHCKKRNLFLT
ncbi:MAG: N-6 DNA methylase [Defluviitaleaceae bacterium]|nr:N-6 DNA methylase [Defluviitaleaceae bacterium]